QAVVLRATIEGEATCLARLPLLQAALDEPYRTVARQVIALHKKYGYVDANVLGSALAEQTLTRFAAGGRRENLEPNQVLGLLFGGTVQAGQALAYLDVLQNDLERKRQEELKARIQGVAAAHADHPELLFQEMERIAREARAAGPG